jgi:type VI secretion system protein VasG
MECFEDDPNASAEEVTQEIRPVLSKHFQPALLARMSIVPYAPIAADAMKSIARLKLRKVVARIEQAHHLRTTVSDALIDEIARRCTEAETGARNVDHILRGSLMPAVARALLERMAATDSATAPALRGGAAATAPALRGGAEHQALCIDLDANGGWKLDFT